ncbi:MAG TPA: hypothetical protein VIW93_00960, partial [Candidatus Acidoferrum sp.]
TPLLRNPMEVRRCSQHAGANADFGDEGAVDWFARIGCGGLQCTEAATLVLPFRYSLAQEVAA